MKPAPPHLDLPATCEALETVQTARRKRAFEKACTSPFYRDRLAGLGADNVTEPQEWAKIPILDKDQLRAMNAETFYTGFCIGARQDTTEFWRSGGSTGRPLFYPRTAEDIRFATIGFQRALDLAGFGVADVAHMSLPLGIHPAGHMMARSGSAAGVGMVWAGGGNTLPSGAQLDLLRLFKPSAWIGMASYGIQLANLAKSEGFDLAAAGIERILCSAEPLSDTKRARLSALWGAPVRDCYGMTEVMMLGCEDAACDGFRFWSDYCFAEVLDETTLEPVAEGMPGLLVVTSLVTNNATPFLRWNTGDIVTLRTGVARGTPYDVFPLIKHTHRTAGFVKLRGVNIGFGDLEDLLFAMPQVSDFRVEVVSKDDSDQLDIHIELDQGGQAEAVTAQIRNTVQRVFGLAPHVVIGRAGGIAKTFEGEFKPARIQDLRP